MKKILIGLFLVAAPLMFAQTDTAGTAAVDASEHSFYLTPFIGLAQGGSFQIRDTQLTKGFQTVSLEGNDIYGLRFGMRMKKWPRAQLELSISRVKTVIEDNAKLFGESPAGEFPPGSTETLDVSITHGQIGFIWDLKASPAATRQDGTMQPFVLGAVGVTDISAFTPLPDEIALNVALGGGTRVWLSRNTALRFEVRGFWVDTDKDEAVTVPITNRDCTGACERTYRYSQGFSMIEATIGFTWGYDQIPYFDKLFKRKKKSDD